jgi:Na+/H+ antiporter NhaD/arsenite permease-like protein
MKVFGIPIEFIFFGLTLAGVGIFHRRSFEFAVGGMLVTLTFELTYNHLNLPDHMSHEWRLLLNLLGLLLGFAILARLFEDSKAPEWLLRFLPRGWLGGWVLLAGVALVSSFVDNIAAAILGGVLAKQVYGGRLRVGYLAAIVAASNAGGAFSIVGDTTTTMMWIAGVPPGELLRAAAASTAVVAFSGFFASRAQQRYQPIREERGGAVEVDFGRVAIVVAIIGGAIAANFLISMPAAGVWVAIVLGSLLRRAPWYEIPASIKGTIFLLSLVFTASLMPVKSLPDPSWQTATGLGYVSAVFDNIPLTALAIFQNGYDWGLLAFTVGYGGSMIWFGSSAGVGICNRFPEAKHTGRWIKEGWHVAVAYAIGVAVFMLLVGWKPIRI